MVRAILNKHKTVTRRLVKPMQSRRLTPEGIDRVPHDSPLGWIRCPYGEPGDRLWAKEAHAIVPCSAYWHDDTIPHRVHVDDQGDRWWSVYREGWERTAPGRWRPSIHMPRWASRITLEIDDVRGERLHEITEADAEREGAQRQVIDCAAGWPRLPSYRVGFAKLWESIHGSASWAANPWVWRVEFRMVEA